MYESEKKTVSKWLDLVRGGSDEVWESYRAMMDDNLTWRLIGTTPISGEHKGLTRVENDFFAKCWAGDGRGGGAEQGLDPNYGIKPLDIREITALEDGRVMVHCFSDGRGKNGVPYKNEYCWIITVKDGKIFKLDEYADTALIERAMFNKEIIPSELVSEKA